MLKSAWIAIVLGVIAMACGAEDNLVDNTLSSDGSASDEYGKPLMDAPPSHGKEDALGGTKGPKDVFVGAPSEVWSTPNAWSDRDTAAAGATGVAWNANSGLDWNEKYALWIRTMAEIESDRGWKTFMLTTPWGPSLPSPALECAETSVFLRATFASWYGLPFYLSAWTANGMVHFGHFGVVRESNSDPGFPNFKTKYEDYSHLSTEEAVENWPGDPTLAKRFLTTKKDDLNPWLGEKAYAGAYFDKIFLNKRVGYFMLIILTYTGSVHLAATDNTFNVKARAVREGDTLLHRWQKRGIGHTMVVKQVDAIEDAEDRLDVTVVSGSMPRRQPKWESPTSSKFNFTKSYGGGPGENYNEEPYASLGGGLKRWRVAKVVTGRWRNVVPEIDQQHFISLADQPAIAARPEIFEQILGDLPPEQKVTALIERIEDKRAHLETYPASCSARIGREETFRQLYDLTEEAWGWTHAHVDDQYRRLEDYVFAELEYDKSRTCCWNSTTNAMYLIIMEYNQNLQDEADENGTCVEPVVFMMQDGDYSVFRDYAVAQGLEESWVSWSADESCPQEVTVSTDTLAEPTWTSWCTLQAFEPPPPTTSNNDGEHR